MADEAAPVRARKTPEGITVITLDRRGRRNAVDAPTARLLAAAFADFDADEGQRVCVLHGAHGTFCAGFDLHALSRGGAAPGPETGPAMGPEPEPEPEPDPSTAAAPVLEPYVPDAAAHRRGANAGPMGPTRMQPRKPVVAAVSGHAVAGGLELALLADVRVAEADAVLGVFCRRWGVPLIDGGTVRLQAVVGLGRALDMILTGRPVPADEALRIGLVNRLVPPGRALPEALALARQLLRFPQACMAADRASCYYAAYHAASFEDAMRFEFDHGVAVVAAEGVPGAASFSRGAGRHGAFGPKM